MGKRELIALLSLSSWCLVAVELALPRGAMGYFAVCDCPDPDHTHLLFITNICRVLNRNISLRRLFRVQNAYVLVKKRVILSRKD